MALKPCRECKKKVSTEAATCPSCGVPNPTTRYSKQTINKKEKSIFVKMFTGYDSEKTSLDKIKTFFTIQDYQILNRESICLKLHIV